MEAGVKWDKEGRTDKLTYKRLKRGERIALSEEVFYDRLRAYVVETG